MRLLWLSGTVVPLLFCLLQSVTGGYMVTAPSGWYMGRPYRICIALDAGAGLNDVVSVRVAYPGPFQNFNFYESISFNYSRGSAQLPEELVKQLKLREQSQPLVVIGEAIIRPALGSLLSCIDLQMNADTSVYIYSSTLRINGTLRGSRVDETRDIRISNNVRVSTYIQTDKQKYKPGQKVQFRVLQLEGVDFQVSFEPYKKIYVENPSGSIIAQWLNVSNPSGLIHLDFQLYTEPDLGTYWIYTESSISTRYSSFEVERYVLKRFEVSVDLPSFVLASAKFLKMEVCARYIFGQPLSGDLAINVKNGDFGPSVKEVNFVDKIKGCKSVEIPLATLGINSADYFVYHLHVDVLVTESLTLVPVKKSLSVSISRTALRFVQLDEGQIPKPELPFFSSVAVMHSDGRPAKNELITVCTRRWVVPSQARSVREELGCLKVPSGRFNSYMTLCPEIVCKYYGVDQNKTPQFACFMSVCRNMSTDATGKLRVTIPPHVLYNSLVEPTVEVFAVNYPALQVNGTDRQYMYQSKAMLYYSTAPYFSPSKSSLQINPAVRKFNCTAGSNIVLDLPVMHAEPVPIPVTLYVEVQARGRIQYWKTFTVFLRSSDLGIDEATLVEPMINPTGFLAGRGIFTLSLTLPPSASPSIRAMIYYIRPDREVVSDVQDLQIDKCLNYPVKLSWPKDLVQQGSQLPLTLTAQPNALCSLGVVDKSVELLSSPASSFIDEIYSLAGQVNSMYIPSSKNEFLHCVRQSCKANFRAEGRSSEQPRSGILGGGQSISSGYYFISKYVDASKLFSDAGVLVVSDLTLETRPCELKDGGGSSGCLNCGGGLLGGLLGSSSVGGLLGGVGGALNGGPSQSGGQLPTTPAVPVTTRVYFPETWLWELLPIPRSGVYSRNRTLPDTITEWVGKAVCVHPQNGIGISNIASITTFTQFFTELTLPAYVKVGEILPLKISVFNYLTTDLPVIITLEPSTHYEILGATGTEAAVDQATAGTRSDCVPDQDKATVIVRIRFLVPGSVNVTVASAVDAAHSGTCGSGNYNSRVDRVINSLDVDYEGFLQEKTYTMYYCKASDMKRQWSITVPESGVISNSARGWVVVSGEVLGLTLENLGQLVRMPYGCGEQNMIRLAPNVILMQYMEASQQQNSTVAKRLIENMRQGYNQQLNYRRTDGSFSVFGNYDEYGSTWLTSFVLKTFAQAKSYISVSNEVLQQTTKWLLSLQLESGCFQRVGYLHNKIMGGGVEQVTAPAALTAYVLAALLETGLDPSLGPIVNATACLEEAIAPGAIGGNDVYLNAVTAYAFSLAGLSQAKGIIDSLLTISTKGSRGIFWSIKSPHGQYSNALSIETSSYVLLAMLISNYDDTFGQGVEIMQWITSRRNGQGGFESTQDTVVALQALTRFGSPVSQGPLNVDITLVGQMFNEVFLVRESNKKVLQRKNLAVVPTDISSSGSGTGCALIQTVLRYNTYTPTSYDIFTLTVVQRIISGDKVCQTSAIGISVSYQLDDGKSNMAVIEVVLETGYVPVVEDLDLIVSDVTSPFMKHEVDGGKVALYVREITKDSILVMFRAYQDTIIEASKPGTVKVYDYYEPSFATFKAFNFYKNSTCGV